MSVFRRGGTVAKQSAGSAANNREWWPNQVRLNVLRQHSPCLTQWVKPLIMLKRSKP
jgi:catalase (peroxidase I)